MTREEFTETNTQAFTRIARRVEAQITDSFGRVASGTHTQIKLREGTCVVCVYWVAGELNAYVLGASVAPKKVLCESVTPEAVALLLWELVQPLFQQKE